MNNTQQAKQAQGAEQQKPFLLFNDEVKANEYVRKVTTFGNEIDKFKIIFKAIVTENLNVTFSKNWLQSIVDGNFEDKVNQELANYLESQPKMLQTTIYKEFEKLALDLYKPAALLKGSFERTVTQSPIHYSPYPNGLDSLQSFPIDDNGSLAITNDWEAQIRKQFESYLTTPQHFERYEALQACLKAQDQFLKVFGQQAPYVWQGLNSNGFLTTNEISNSHLNNLIKW